MHTAHLARRCTTLFAAAAAFVALATTQSAHANNLDFDIVNRTDQPIVGLWASPTSSGSWGRAFDNTFVADRGGRQSVRFNGSASACRYDVRVQFDGGAVRYWNDLNLCAVSGMQVYVSGGEVKAQTW